MEASLRCPLSHGCRNRSRRRTPILVARLLGSETAAGTDRLSLGRPVTGSEGLGPRAAEREAWVRSAGWRRTTRHSGIVRRTRLWAAAWAALGARCWVPR